LIPREGISDLSGNPTFPRIFIALPFCPPQRALEIHRFRRRRF
jgi:hypothetical protein